VPCLLPREGESLPTPSPDLALPGLPGGVAAGERDGAGIEVVDAGDAMGRVSREPGRGNSPSRGDLGEFCN